MEALSIVQFDAHLRETVLRHMNHPCVMKKVIQEHIAIIFLAYAPPESEIPFVEFHTRYLLCSVKILLLAFEIP